MRTNWKVEQGVMVRQCFTLSVAGGGHPGTSRHSSPILLTFYSAGPRIRTRPSVVLQNYFSSHLLGAECLCSSQVYMLKT